MWLKPFIVIILFYFFAILQNSFFTHFVFSGGVLNLIFILFFLFVFFEKQKSYYWAFFYAVVAGLFLDIFSYASLGISIVLLMAMAFLIKKTQSSLKEEKDNFSLLHFALLFLVSFILYSLLLQTCIFIIIVPHVFTKFSLGFIIEIIYNLFFAVLAFLICKKYVKERVDTKQISLFRNK